MRTITRILSITALLCASSMSWADSNAQGKHANDNPAKQHAMQQDHKQMNAKAGDQNQTREHKQTHQQTQQQTQQQNQNRHQQKNQQHSQQKVQHHNNQQKNHHNQHTAQHHKQLKNQHKYAHANVKNWR